jgi:hypothetical protein
MTRTILALIAVALLYGLVGAIESQNTFEEEVERLRKQVKAGEVMLADTHRLYGILERRVMKVDTGMSARQMLWHIEEIAATSACIEVHQ